MDDNKLLKISDVDTIYHFLLQVKDKDCDVYVWKLIGNSKYLSKVKIELVRKARNDISIIPLAGFETEVEDIMATQSYIDIFIPEFVLLFRCKIKQADSPERYYLKFPDFVAQLDRRKSLRLTSYDESQVKIVFSKSTLGPKSIKQHFLKNCFDISLGGCSFYISKAELRYFNIDDSNLSLQLKVGDWSTNVKCKIQGIRELEPNETNRLNYKAFRISCSFIEIDSISKKYLERYIFEQIKLELHAINK